MKSNKTKSAMTALVIAAMICTAAMPVKAEESKWVNNEGNWSLIKADGKKATGWVKDGDCWYAFDENGSMRTGWVASHEHWYFMGESGVMQVNTLVEDNGAKYFVKGTGVMAKDYVKDGYEFTSDGKAIPLSESKSVVLTDAAELEGKVIEGNLYVDVTTAKEIELKGVTVKGKLIIIGDNETKGKLTLTDSTVETINTQSRNSEVVLSGDTEVKNIVIEETAKVTTDKDYKGKVENFEIQSTTKGTVVIEVPAENVSTNSYAIVDVQAPVENLEVRTETEVKVNSDVKNVTVAETAKNTTVEVGKGSTVGTITADAPVKIDGKGTVEKVEANVDGVEAGKDTTIKEVETGKDVTEAPDATKPDKGGSSGGGSDSGSDTRPTVKQLTVDKIKYANDAVGVPTEAINNQKNITLTTEGNVVRVRSNNTLEQYTSSNAEQGEGQWIGFVLDTGETSILGLSVDTGSGWNEFTQADIDEAASVGAGAGKFVFWMKADVAPQRTIKVRKGGNGIEKSVIIKYNSLVQLAEIAKNNFDSKQADMDWDTVITTAYYYDELAEATKSDNSLKGKLDELTEYYASIKTLDLSNKDTSKYTISTGALKMFTGLTDLGLRDTGISELGGLVGMTSLITLDISCNNLKTMVNNDSLGAIANLSNITELYLYGNDGITTISAIANLSNLQKLDVSMTSITDFDVFWNTNEKKARFPQLKEVYANNIQTLTSIAGLVEVANETGFTNENKQWNLYGSILASDPDNHIKMITEKFKDSNSDSYFNAPTIKGIVPEFQDIQFIKNEYGETEIQFERLNVETGVKAYTYELLGNPNQSSYSLTVEDVDRVVVEEPFVTLERMVSEITIPNTIIKDEINFPFIRIRAYNNENVVIAESVIQNNVKVVNNKNSDFCEITTELFEGETTYLINSELLKNLGNKRLYVNYMTSEKKGNLTFLPQYGDLDYVDGKLVLTGKYLDSPDIKFAVTIIDNAIESNEENADYIINRTLLNKGEFVSPVDVNIVKQ